MRYLLILTLLFCSLAGAADVKIDLKSGERDQYISRAQIWKPTEISKMNILAGPQNEVSVPLNAQVECEYIEPKEQLAGRWPKFLCKTTKGHVVRVKYGAENQEIYAESLGTRLLWALGFYADEVYPVVVKCNKCPENPFQPESGKRGTFLFKDAIMERNFPGITIEEKEDQGWTWEELEKVKISEGGASQTQLDAFRLLAVMIQHADAKPDNQRLACYPQDVVDPDGDGLAFCKQPVLMIQDLGATFGGGQDVTKISRIDLKAWDAQGVFNTPLEAKSRARGKNPVCYGNLTASYLAGQEGLSDPIISDEGRKFLAGLLNQLSDKQIRDLFMVARVDQLDQTMEEGDTTRPVTIDDWVEAFKKKRKEVQEKSCPQPPQQADLHREE
jgi:hypothetical protein